jgi:hypothetical protein
MAGRTSRAEFVFVSPPATPVTRIGRQGTNLWKPNSWASPRRRDDGTFGYRFDDPGDVHNPPIPDKDKFRMIYCSTTLVGALCEVGARELPTLDELAAATNQPPQGVLDEGWCSTRAAGYTVLDAALLFLDVASRQTTNALREAPPIARLARRMGYRDIDPTFLRGPDRRFTQEIARYIYEQSGSGGAGLPGQPGGVVVAGIRYLSRHGDEKTDYECWAVFDKRIIHSRRENIPLSLKTGSPLAAGIREAAMYLGLSVDHPI